jgi:hypothetical protein
VTNTDNTQGKKWGWRVSRGQGKKGWRVSRGQGKKGGGGGVSRGQGKEMGRDE